MRYETTSPLPCPQCGNIPPYHTYGCNAVPYTSTPPQLTEADIRRIVREELDRIPERYRVINGELFRVLPGSPSETKER